MTNEELNVEALLQKIYRKINSIVFKATKEALEQLNVKPLESKETNLDEEYLSAIQAASYLKLKLNTIYQKSERGELQFFRGGRRRLLFAKKDLEAYILKTRAKSNDEIQEEVDKYLEKRYNERK